MRRRFALAALLLASPASAGGFEPVDPVGTWRAMTHDAATTTSRCIGSAETPVCAVETLIACNLRHAPELCRSATGRPREFSTETLASEWLRYRITRASLIQPEDFARQHLGHFGTEPWRPGDMLVETVEETCYPTFCEPAWEMINVLRPVDGGWRVVDGQPVVMD